MSFDGHGQPPNEDEQAALVAPRTIEHRDISPWIFRGICLQKRGKFNQSVTGQWRCDGVLRLTTISTALLLTLVVACRRNDTNGAAPKPAIPTPASSFSTLLGLASEKPSAVDIAHMNLLCAEGLSGLDGASITQHLAQLDEWAKRVKSETERHHYRFQRKPAEFEHSESYFKMLMLTVVLAEDFEIHYHPGRRVNPEAASRSDGFFSDARDVFLHGLLGPRRRGTCSSLPVLYVAIGRRLGYPLKLVTTKGHLFLRWDGEGDRFNVEAAGEGFNRFDDAYYRRWPYSATDEEVATEGYLKSLGPKEELAVFLSIRGSCLREAGRRVEAAGAFAMAARLAPNCAGYRKMSALLDREEKPPNNRGE